jgi:hypothetical protein
MYTAQRDVLCDSCKEYHITQVESKAADIFLLIGRPLIYSYIPSASMTAGGLSNMIWVCVVGAAELCAVPHYTDTSI